MNLLNFLIVLFLTTYTIATAPTIDVVFIIQSQNSHYHNTLSQKLKKYILKQSMELQTNYSIRVYLLHEILNYPGDWTIHNLIPQLVSIQSSNNVDTHTNRFEKMEIIKDKTRWIVFCEDKTMVRLKILMDSLNKENHMQPVYLGYPLYDREPTIIHHFAFFENPKWFPYPMLRAGVVISRPLFESIAQICASDKDKLFKQQFSIDAAHELARFIYDNIQIPVISSAASHCKNHHINVYHPTSSYGTLRAEKSTSLLATGNTNDEPQQTTTNHCNIVNFYGAGMTNNVDVSHSAYSTKTSDDINDKHKNEILKPSTGGSGLGNTSTITVTKISIIKKQKIILKKASYICPTATWENRSSSDVDNLCAMYPEQAVNPTSSMSCTPIKREDVYFAVKTCSKYRNDRLPIIQATWARYATHIKYFSDIQDYTIPTTYAGVPNVEMGHCAKTLQILKLALEDIKNYNNKQQYLRQANQAKHEYHPIQWLFLSDDDTLLSVSGVCQVLGCYNSMDEIYLGERYGYRLFARDGFNYITGGGGIAFSLPVVELILQYCSCPSPTAPDDMILGSCLHSLQLKALHSTRFHQARPNDYSLELLKQEPPVSFHKFWQLDPLDVYKNWFAAEDHSRYGDSNFNYKKLNNEDPDFKAHKLSANTDTLNLNKLPELTSMHHSKERHVDL